MTIPVWEQYKGQLEEISKLKYNFDLESEEKITAKLGWNVDHHQIELPSESAGAAEIRGSFFEAKRVIHDYKFPDPKLISGIFVPTGPLLGRNMLLQAHFMGFSFFFGVRVTKETNEIRHTPLGAVEVWGYSYATLQGHFEMGRITFEVWKYLSTGKVEFHIDSYSKSDRIPNFFYRVGFKIFGRSLQKRFALTALARTRAIVTAELAQSRSDMSNAKSIGPDRLDVEDFNSPRHST